MKSKNKKHKRSKKKNKSKGAEEANKPEGLSTITIAIPGSILENAQSPELRSYLAGQLARAACIFQIDEVVIFDDVGLKNASSTKGVSEIEAADGEEVVRVRKSCTQFAKILQYLECRCFKTDF